MNRSTRGFLALSSLAAATLLLAGCPAPASNDTTTTNVSQIPASSDPFAGMASGSGSLKEAAGMAGDSKNAGMRPGDPLTQQSAYRTAAVGALVSEEDGPYVSHFTITSETKTPGTGTLASDRIATYTTTDEDNDTIETGLDDRQATVSVDTASYSIEIFDGRRVDTSRRRDPGLYVTGGLQTLSATEDVRVFAEYRQSDTGGTSSVQVVTVDEYQPDSNLSDVTLASQIAGRGRQTLDVIAIKGKLPSGQQIDFTRGWALKDGFTFRYFKGAVDLGSNQGHLAFTSQLAMYYGSYDPVFPLAASGSIVLQRQDANSNPLADITITGIDINQSTKTAHTVGTLHDARGAVAGSFDGTIDKRAGKWLGTYQFTGKASQSLDLSGVLEHML